MATPENLHKNIPNGQLHSPKDFSTAGSGTALRKGWDGDLKWEVPYWQDSVLDRVDMALTPPTEFDGDRYILINLTSTVVHADWDGASENDIVEYDLDASAWVSQTPFFDITVRSQADLAQYYFDGTTWTASGISSTPTLSEVLTAGNATGANNIDLGSGQRVAVAADDNDDWVGISATGSTATLMAQGSDIPASATQIDLTKSTATITSTAGAFAGLQEASDYSANYSALSLVNKTYVDGQISGLGTLALVGTYTSGYVPRWNATTNTLESGTIRDNGTTTGIGATPIAAQKLKINHTNTGASQYYGIFSQVDGDGSTGNIISASLTANGGASSSDCFGVQGIATNSSTATGDLHAGWFDAYTSGTGTVPAMYGIKIDRLDVASGKTVDDTYGIYIAASSGAGTFTNTPYGIYQAGANDLNYFAGQITTNNGIIYDPVAGDADIDIIEIGVTGSPKIYWDESENSFRLTTATWLVDTQIGIGSPSFGSGEKIEVKGTGNQYIRIESTDTNDAGLFLQSGAGGSVHDWLVYSNSSDFKIKDVDNATDRLIIDSSGNVQINERVGVGIAPSSSAAIVTEASSTSLSNIRLTGGTANVSSPVDGDLWYNTTAGTLNFYDGSTTTDLLSGGGGGGTPAGSTGQIQFNTSGAFDAESTLFWDKTNDRLGIGTASPNYELHVGGADSNTYMQITNSLSGTTGTDGCYFGLESTTFAFIQNETGGISFRTGGADRMIIQNGGVVEQKIGAIVGGGSTSLVGAMSVHKTTGSYIHFANTSTGFTGGDGFYVGHDNAVNGAILYLKENQPIIFSTNDTEQMRLKGSGVLNYKNCPTSSAGLSAGDIWNDSGTLKIV